MNRTLAKHLFLAIERLRGERVDLYLAEMEANQFLPPAELERLQQERLSALLDFAVTRNDYYRNKYSGVDARHDLRRLPLLTKAQLREGYRAIVSAEDSNLVKLCKTSGSTGEPLKFYRDSRVFGRTLASVYRAHRWYGLEVGAKEAMLWGIPSSRLNRFKMRARDFVLNRFREAEYSLDPGVLQRFFQDIQNKRPEYLFGYSSMIYEFAMFADERHLSTRELGLKGAVCTAESIPEFQRELIERVFGCPVISEYGAAETGIISYQCPAGGHHVSADAVAVEILDESNQPTPIGEVGRVVVTVLHSQAAPIIRYDLGDYAALSARTCECGCRLPLLDRIVGRTSGIIVTPSGRCFHSIVLYYIMKDYADKFGGVRQFRVRQTDIDRLEFHIVAGAGFLSESQQWLLQAAKRQFGEDMRVEFFFHAQLSRTEAGKLRDFESDLDMRDHLIASFRTSGRVKFLPEKRG